MDAVLGLRRFHRFRVLPAAHKLLHLSHLHRLPAHRWPSAWLSGNSSVEVGNCRVCCRVFLNFLDGGINSSHLQSRKSKNRKRCLFEPLLVLVLWPPKFWKRKLNTLDMYTVYPGKGRVVDIQNYLALKSWKSSEANLHDFGLGLGSNKSSSVM